ncbi:MAG: hypothetical protein WC661_21825 [Opitutaceae bacterium]|jgi:hypothetical protein
MNPQLLNDPRAKRWGNVAKYGAVLVVGFFAAPYVWVSIGGLIGLVVAFVLITAVWMTRRLVPIGYGLPMPEFLEAMNLKFPNAALQMGGCCVSDSDPTEAPDYVCPVCEAAYQAWSAQRKTE